MEQTQKELGIYIHIPFCKQKCYYCDFISYSNKTDLVEEYIESISKEIQDWKNNTNIEKYKISTIYIGGGTPSYIEEKHIMQILENLKEFINPIQETEVITPLERKMVEENKQELNSQVEITIEVNPGIVTKSKLEQYKKAGINRLSIGLQETHDELLKQIGRIHTYSQFKETYNLAKEVGFENINIDLMIGLPNQTIQHIKENLEKVIKLEPSHISVYSLILEENTVLEKQVCQGKLTLPDEEQERAMYWYVKNTLELNGYNQYEISNFAKKEKESKHNMNCWEQEEYRGFGIAAHSYIGGIRFSNTSTLEEYIKNVKENNLNINIQVHEIQEKEDMQKEYMLLGLRKLEGVSISKFKNKYGENPIFLYHEELQELVESKLIKIDGDRIKLTNRGLDLANQVWEKFV